jgi:hypothetical protein
MNISLESVPLSKLEGVKHDTNCKAHWLLGVSESHIQGNDPTKIHHRNNS